MPNTALMVWFYCVFFKFLKFVNKTRNVNILEFSRIVHCLHFDLFIVNNSNYKVTKFYSGSILYKTNK